MGCTNPKPVPPPKNKPLNQNSQQPPAGNNTDPNIKISAPANPPNQPPNKSEVGYPLLSPNHPEPDLKRSHDYKNKNQSGIIEHSQEVKDEHKDEVKENDDARENSKIHLNSNHNSLLKQSNFHESNGQKQEVVSPNLSEIKKSGSHIENMRPSPVHVGAEWNQSNEKRLSYDEVYDQSMVDYGQSTVEDPDKLEIALNI